jgi:hypothetical protein
VTPCKITKEEMREINLKSIEDIHSKGKEVLYA